MEPLDEHPMTSTDLAARGLSRRDQARLLESGALRRVVRGVYVRDDVPDTVSLRARSLALVLPPGSVVCDRTAAWLWGIDVLGPLEPTHPSRIEVVRVGGDRSRNGAVLGGKRALVDDEIVEIDGVRVTTPVRTACDLACLRGRYLALAVYDAFARQFGLTPADYAKQLERYRGRRGSKQARELAAHAIAGAESTGESWTRMAILDAGLPSPTAQVWVTLTDHGPIRLDLAYEQLLIAVEYDGEEFHGSDEARAADERRRDALRRAGWVVVVVRKDDFSGPALDRWLDELRAARRDRLPTYFRTYSRGENYRGPRR